MEINSDNGRKSSVNLNTNFPSLGRNLEIVNIYFPKYFIKFKIFEKIKSYFNM